MTTNPYLNFYTASNEQDLFENLIIESIKMYGFDSYYLPKTLDSYDEVFRESDVNKFDSAISLEVYLKTSMGFEGDGQFMGKILGDEIRDSVTFTVAKRRFEEEAGDGFSRPREGDLIYMPLDKKVYEIKFVDHQSVFYQLGRLNVYDLSCELLEYNGQIFNTGISEVDSINTIIEINGDEDSSFDDHRDQSEEFQDETPDIIDWSENDPFSNGGSI
jgi:hypothetical protein